MRRHFVSLFFLSCLTTAIRLVESNARIVSLAAMSLLAREDSYVFIHNTTDVTPLGLEPEKVTDAFIDVRNSLANV